ncbi:hypothetical protein, partial [Shigella flexneri]|uniref:hypothetical protein n=1 Tax=Shigella flexneri TaxID=623 RepID=UPI000A9CFA6B
QIDLFKQFKAIADKKKSVSDRDIHAIIQGSEHEHQALINWKHYNYHMSLAAFKVLLLLLKIKRAIFTRIQV